MHAAYHGCPYRHSTDQQLVAQLNGMKLSSPDVNDIMKLAKSSNYQLACQKHFDVTHPDHLKMDLGVGEGGAVSNHPNMWYQTSVKYHRAKAGGKAGATPATGGGAKASGDRMDVESNVEDGSASVSMEVA
jgi:DNA primase large subunit